MFTTALTVNLAITVLFWSLIFPSALDQYPPLLATAEGIADHLFPLLLCVAESAMNMIEFKWLRLVGPLVFVGGYCAFSIVVG